MVEQKDVSSPLMKTPKSQLTAEDPLTNKTKKPTGIYQKAYAMSKDKEEATKK